MASARNIKIKICGMRDAENIAQVAGLGPDYMGFIFYPQSPRYVGGDFKLKKATGRINYVGVFVNASFEEIMKQSELSGFDHVQLHGHESVDDAARLKEAGLKVIKVFSVDDQFDFSITIKYIPSVDYFLFDTKGKFYGGNATTFNWKILQQYHQEVPFFLSGGISGENVSEIVMLEGMNVHALDVNSGVEESPGMKSLDKLRNVFEVVDKIGLRRKSH